ncbi:MAG TPA: DUF4340 domain-containing protein [Acetobacteraceae bacterium]|nr:DUF4340 domain-containing protein [Acetobacteraceae bacterium]
MRPQTALVLAALAVVALLGGWYLGPGSEPATAAFAEGRLAFPGLAAGLQHAARVEITHRGKTLTIEKHGPVWGVAERGDYPVRGDKLRRLLESLTELRLTTRLTNDPAQLPQLGLGDPHAAGTDSALLRVLDAAGKPIAALVLGHQKYVGGDQPETIYVRRPGTNQAWVATGGVAADADAGQWLDHDIVDIAPDAIKSVSVTTAGEHLQFTRHGDTLALTEPANAPPLDADKLGDISRALDHLRFADVQMGPTLPGAPAGQAAFTLNDGMVLTVTVNTAKNALWANFAASGGERGAALQKRLHGWAYKLDPWQRDAFVPTLADLKAEKKAASAAAQ